MPITEKVKIYKIADGQILARQDLMLSEFRLQILFRENTYTLPCTGFQLKELAAGFLYTEHGVDISRTGYEIQLTEEESRAVIRICGPAGHQQPCCCREEPGAACLSYRKIDQWMAEFSQKSRLFKETGNVHSAGFVSADGSINWFCEDIGRHNALDKLVGKGLFQGISLSGGTVLLSGRVPTDMMRKLIRAGATAAVSVSAPTSDSVRQAKEAGITLIGFARKGRMNIYSHPDRITELQGKRINLAFSPGDS